MGEAALEAAAAELQGFVAEAEALAARFHSLAQREHLVAERTKDLDEAVDRLSVRQAALDTVSLELDRRERALATLEGKTAKERDALDRTQQQLAKLGGGSAAAEPGLRPRDRWWRGWRQRSPRLGEGSGQACDLLFLPTSEGYELLHEDGLALRRGARLVLSPGGPTFSVSKIAPWPFDGRRCAYLQQEL